MKIIDELKLNPTTIKFKVKTFVSKELKQIGRLAFRMNYSHEWDSNDIEKFKSLLQAYYNKTLSEIDRNQFLKLLEQVDMKLPNKNLNSI